LMISSFLAGVYWTRQKDWPNGTTGLYWAEIPVGTRPDQVAFGRKF
jgi:hypothetical protein